MLKCNSIMKDVIDKDYDKVSTFRAIPQKRQNDRLNAKTTV